MITRARNSRKPGFSPLEVLVALSILGMVLGLLMSGVQAVRGSAARLQCQNNLKQIAAGCHNYESRSGCFPPWNASHRIPGVSHRAVNLPWTVLILSDLEREALYRAAVADHSRSLPFSVPAHEHRSTVVPQYVCPADGRLATPLTDELGTAAYCSYVGIQGPQWLFPNQMQLPLGVMDDRNPPLNARGAAMSEILDGTSNTIHFGESPPFGRWVRSIWYAGELPFAENWTARPSRNYTVLNTPVRAVNLCRGPFPFGPGQLANPCDSHHLWSLHGNGANFAFADGSVRFLSYAARDIIPALATVSGGETVSIP